MFIGSLLLPQKKKALYTLVICILYQKCAADTNYVQQSPSWEANKSSASQDTPHILWNPKVHYRIHNSQSTVPTLSQINPVHTTPPNFLKIHFNIVLPSMPWSYKWSLSLTSPYQNPVRISPLPHTCHIPRPSPSSLDHPNNIWWGVQFMKFLVM